MYIPKLLAVDDSEGNRYLLRSLLEEKYQIYEAESGQKCLDLITEVSPDLVLLDINMPEMNGYEVCKAIRHKKPTNGLPIIFVSSLDTVEERLKGFEVGADDYITKPFDASVLLEKVAFRLMNREKLIAAETQAQESMKVAMEAMTSSSELGEIIQFVQMVQSLHSNYDVIHAFLDACSRFGLNACASWTDNQGFKLAGCEPQSIEARLLREYIPGRERINIVGVRCLLVTHDFTALIKNMPVHEEARFGRLKDHLAILQDIAGGRIESIRISQLMLSNRETVLREIIELAEKKIKSTSQEIDKFSLSINLTMSTMLQDLETMLFSLGLDEDQEQALINLADQTSNELHKNSNHAKRLDGELGQVLEALYNLLSKDSMPALRSPKEPTEDGGF